MGGLKRDVGNFQPTDGGEVIEAETPRSYLNISREGEHLVTTGTPPRYADVTDDTADSAAWDQEAQTFRPHLVKLVQELFVGINVP